MGAEDEEIGIARNDKIWPRGDGERQHSIVVKVAAARCQQRRRIDDFREAANFGQHLYRIGVGPAKYRAEFCSHDDAGQFGE